MKKLYSSIAAALLCGQLFAGGIVTNSNQSIHYLRMLARSASGEIDAVYYNPAGIMRMNNGFHVYASNMSLFQTRTLTSESPLSMNNTVFEGDVNAYAYPNLYAVYKMDKIAFALGFGPNGGGGSAEFQNGLPMFEMPLASLPALLSGATMPTTAYEVDAYFKGSSVYFGTQLNFTYEINDMLSVGAGVRMINASNSYKGHLRNIMINPDLSAHQLGAFLPMYTGSMVSASEFFTNLSGALDGAASMAYGGATQAYNAATGLQPLIDNSIPDLETALAGGLIDQATYDGLTGGLGDNYTAGMNPALVQGAYNTMGDEYTSAAQEYETSASDARDNATATGDLEVDATQSGLAFTPIISANITPIEGLNIGIKYELNTKLELENSTTIDGTGYMFPDGQKFRSDIPAILALGIEYELSEKFRTQISHVTYFDKGADWEGKEDKIDKNLFELAIGLEFDLSDKLSVSGGYSLGQAGPQDAYQSELSYTNSSHTVGLGLQFRANEKLTIDVGGMNTTYVDHTVDYPIGETTTYSTTYDKKSLGIGIGIAYTF